MFQFDFFESGHKVNTHVDFVTLISLLFHMSFYIFRQPSSPLATHRTFSADHEAVLAVERRGYTNVPLYLTSITASSGKPPILLRMNQPPYCILKVWTTFLYSIHLKTM